MSEPTRLEEINAMVALINGIQKYLPTATLPIDGKFTPATEIVSTLEGLVEAGNAVLLAEARWHGAIKARDTQEAASKSYVDAVKQSILAMFYNQPEVLVTFELSPRKEPAKRTGEEDVIAAAKAKATREARHTLSQKEKDSIHGSLTGTISVPVDGSAPTVGAPSLVVSPATNGSTRS